MLRSESHIIPSAVSPRTSDSDCSEEDETPGPQRIASSLPSLDPKDALIATVVSGTVTQATGGLGGDIPCAELLRDVPILPSRTTFVGSVNSLHALRAESFSSEEARKAAVLPHLLTIREAILALPEALFRRKLMPQVERINAFSK
jgi:hypothetical protein